jgi:hypothetical protein
MSSTVAVYSRHGFLCSFFSSDFFRSFIGIIVFALQSYEKAEAFTPYMVGTYRGYITSSRHGRTGTSKQLSSANIL